MENHPKTDQTGAKPAEKPSWHRKILLSVGVTTVAAAFLAVMGAGIVFLHGRAALEARPQAPQPTPVTTYTFKLQDSHAASSRYVGRLEPARQTDLAFERAGLVLTLMKDEGDFVGEGQGIAKLDTAQLKATRNQLEAQLRELEARRRLATLTHARQSKLNKKGWSPTQRVDEAEATLAELAASLDRVTAQIASIDIDIEKSIIKAPFDGTVGSRTINEGAVVTPGQKVLTILESDRRQARIGLPPDVANTLDASRIYTIESSKEKFEAQIAARRPDLQTGTRTVTVLFDVTGAEQIPFGDVVTLELETKIYERGAWVPIVALHEGHRGLWNVLTIVQKDNEQHAQTETVEILHIEGERAFVRGTLTSGSEIIIGGTNRIVSGQRISRVGD